MKRIVCMMLIILIIFQGICLADEDTNERRYQQAVLLMNAGDYTAAVRLFEALEDYKDSRELADKARQMGGQTGIASGHSSDSLIIDDVFEASGDRQLNPTDGGVDPQMAYETLSVNINGKTISTSLIRSIPAEAVLDSEHGLYVGSNLVAAVPEARGLSYYSFSSEYRNQRCFSNSVYGTSEEVWDVLLYSYNRLESEYGTTWNHAIVTDSPIWAGKKVLIDCCYNIPSYEWGEMSVIDWHGDLESNGYSEELSDLVQFTLPSGCILRGFIHNQVIYMNDNHFINQELNVELEVNAESRVLCSIDLWIPDEGGTAEYISEDELWRIILPYMPVPVV